MLVTILIFIIILAILVFVHEFGHFIVARKTGMQVEEFGFGFPPRMVGIQKIHGKWKFVWGHKQGLNSEHTIYSINWIPLGGFVRILGENNAEGHNPKSFINRSFGARLATLLAGVFMNLLLAWVLTSASFMSGLPAAIGDGKLPAHATLVNVRSTIVEVLPGMPADKAGIKPGDVFVSINDEKFNNLTEVQNYIKAHQGQKLNFVVERKDQDISIPVDSISNPQPGQGATGIALADVGRLSYPWYIAIWQGLKDVVGLVGTIFAGLYGLFVTKNGFAQLGGPVKIAQLTGQVADMGFIYLVQFTAFLSINLAVLNVLPFPALDGGRVLFLIIEKIRGKRNNQKVEQWVNTAGFVFLILLMLVVTFRDIFVHK